jgi:hypothetical protein
MMWLPFSRHASATPLIARLSLSVAPEVKTISAGEALMEAAIWWRAFFTAAVAF